MTVERAALLKSLGHVHRVVERRNTIPILANVLIKADKGKLSLKATDLGSYMLYTKDAQYLAASGSAVMPAAAPSDAASSERDPGRARRLARWSAAAERARGLTANGGGARGGGGHRARFAQRDLQH